MSAPDKYAYAPDVVEVGAPEQLAIEVPHSPNAIARWDSEREMEAYGKTAGETALRRQRQLAAKVKECTCGRQSAADIVAKTEGRKTKKLYGHQHVPGCNSYARPSKLTVAISDSEMKARYEEQRESNGEES